MRSALAYSIRFATCKVYPARIFHATIYVQATTHATQRATKCNAWVGYAATYRICCKGRGRMNRMPARLNRMPARSTALQHVGLGCNVATTGRRRHVVTVAARLPAHVRLADERVCPVRLPVPRGIRSERRSEQTPAPSAAAVQRGTLRPTHRGRRCCAGAAGGSAAAERKSS
jgi:hypothetical protein